MYLAAGIVTIAFVGLFLASAREESEQRGILAPFHKMSRFLYRQAHGRGLSLFADRQVEKDLERLHPGESREKLCAEYYGKKIALMLCLCAAGTFLGVVLRIKAQTAQALDGEGRVKRGTYLEQPQEILVKASYFEQPFSIAVGEERLSAEEADALCQTFWEELQGKMLGENPSLQEVSTDLHLADVLEGYPFAVEWESGSPELIDSSGQVGALEDEASVLLRAVVTYKDREWQKEVPVHLKPLQLSEEERQHKDLQKLLEDSELASREEALWRLPGDYQGEALAWRQVTRDSSLLIWGGILVTALMVYFLTDKDLHDTLGKRKERMKREYPDIVQKLALYMGAGMTIRRAFRKIADDYEHGKTQGGRQEPAYEEMLYACRELQAGISEGAVYERFGKRTGLQEYIRLCTLLQQNLQKGNSTLLERLKEEAGKSVLEKMQGSKKRGEEAATKLLLPMVMMLLTVMLMVMVPAFSATMM